MYFLSKKNVLLYSRAVFIQTKCIVMVTMDKSTKIVNSMTPGTGLLVLRYGHIVKMQYEPF